MAAGRVGLALPGPRCPLRAPGSGRLAALGWAVGVRGSGLSPAAVSARPAGLGGAGGGPRGGRGGAGDRVPGAVVAAGAGEWEWAGPRSIRSPLCCSPESSRCLPDLVSCVPPGWGWGPGHRTPSWDPVPDLFVFWDCLRARFFSPGRRGVASSAPGRGGAGRVPMPEIFLKAFRPDALGGCPASMWTALGTGSG